MTHDGPVEIRSATVAETEQVMGAITAAFVTDPVARYMFPEPRNYLAAMPLMASCMGGPSLEHGSAFVAPCFRGAALWLPPDVHGDTEPMVPYMLEHCAPERVENMARVMEQMEASHPDETHWYLPLIGVDPNAQGQGLGAALMKHACGLFDEQGVVAYLESSNPRNVSLYERHGFEAIREIHIGDAPVVTPMVRRPRG